MNVQGGEREKREKQKEHTPAIKMICQGLSVENWGQGVRMFLKMIRQGLRAEISR